MSHALKIGDLAPEFSLPDAHGNVIALETFRDKWVVLFFYPKDDTPGCTKQACAFRDAYKVFQDANAVVLGVSTGHKTEHQRFAQTHQLPFPLLVDEHNTLRKLYRVPKTLGLLPGRVTYVISPVGRIALIFNSQFNTDGHIREALACIQSHTPEEGVPSSQTL
jgi:thioredoxin-dependent peroxiredoxin